MVNVVFVNKPDVGLTLNYSELVQKMIALTLYTAICPTYSSKPILLIKIATGPNHVPVIFTTSELGDFIRPVDQRLVFLHLKPIKIRSVEVVSTVQL